MRTGTKKSNVFAAVTTRAEQLDALQSPGTRPIRGAFEWQINEDLLNGGSTCAVGQSQRRSRQRTVSWPARGVAASSRVTGADDGPPTLII